MREIERLFREFHGPVVRYLTRQLQDADLAEELAQETFVRASRQEQLSNARAWLFAVATNLVRDAIRRETRQRRRLMELHAEGVHADRAPDAADAEEVSPEERRQAALAREALYDIPERDRAALFMSQEGLNYQEIAAALGLSVQSVGTTLTRARKKVVQRFEGLSRQHDRGGEHVAS